MLVRHAMSSAVVSVTPIWLCRDVLRMFQERGFRRAPVLEHDQVVGMVSKHDLAAVVPSVIGVLEVTGSKLGTVTVAEVMTRKVASAGPDDHLEDVARTMLTLKIGSLPVIEHGRLVGIVTESDVFRMFVQMQGSNSDARVTISIPTDRVPGQASLDPALLCARLGLQLTSLLAFESPGGAMLKSLRVRGARIDELLEKLANAGYAIVEVERARALEPDSKGS